MPQNHPKNQAPTKQKAAPCILVKAKPSKRDTSHCNFQDLCLDDATRPSPEKLASKIEGNTNPCLKMANTKAFHRENFYSKHATLASWDHIFFWEEGLVPAFFG